MCNLFKQSSDVDHVGKPAAVYFGTGLYYHRQIVCLVRFCEHFIRKIINGKWCPKNAFYIVAE